MVTHGSRSIIEVGGGSEGSAGNATRVALTLGKRGLSDQSMRLLIWTLFLQWFAGSLVPSASGDSTKPTSAPSALPKAQIAGTGADGLTTDRNKWRLVRGNSFLYADEDVYRKIQEHGTDDHDPIVWRLRGEGRFIKIRRPEKVELLQEHGPHGMCKVRNVSQIPKRTRDAFVAESDIIPFDQALYDKARLLAENDDRLYRGQLLYDYLKRFEGKTVHIKKGALLLPDDNYWEFLLLLRTREDAQAVKKAVQWATASDETEKFSSTTLAGENSFGVVNSIDSFPYLVFVRIETAIEDGRNANFWVTASDVGLEGDALMPPVLHRLSMSINSAGHDGEIKKVAIEGLVKHAAERAISNVEKSQSRDGTESFLHPSRTLSDQRSLRSRVSIDSQSADVEITECDQPTPEIINQTNENEVTFEKTITGASIKIVSKSHQMAVTNPGRIVVRVPSSYDIDAKGMSARFTVTGFQGETLTLSSMSGTIDASAIGTAHTRFKSMSGNIRVICPIIAGTHEFQSMSGDVAVLLAPGSSAIVFAQSEKSSASINDRDTRIAPIEDVVGSGGATIRATTISGEVDCSY